MILEFLRCGLQLVDLLLEFIEFRLEFLQMSCIFLEMSALFCTLFPYSAFVSILATGHSISLCLGGTILI